MVWSILGRFGVDQVYLRRLLACHIGAAVGRAVRWAVLVERAVAVDRIEARVLDGITSMLSEVTSD